MLCGDGVQRALTTKLNRASSHIEYAPCLTAAACARQAASTTTRAQSTPVSHHEACVPCDTEHQPIRVPGFRHVLHALLERMSTLRRQHNRLPAIKRTVAAGTMPWAAKRVCNTVSSTQGCNPGCWPRVRQHAAIRQTTRLEKKLLLKR